ncbi:hypothetical protein SKAU_G00332060 [Synaphobranchus kaupii]|uniref:Ig-like domain-containing protein n=1 Tax=Synaphobranchus kaupii TaxID=118154 RepID=A0A9Q1ELJ0_SYNKA|nr:hypothetical protein SKAU_G00332060 [Synaphobranchus kaupii]
MVQVLTRLTGALLWWTGLVLSRKVHQSPAELVKDSGDSMQLNCSHAIPSYNNILWYHQAAGDSALIFMGNVFSGCNLFAFSATLRNQQDQAPFAIILYSLTTQRASMIMHLIRFTLTLACLSSSAVCLTVLQSPAELTVRRGEAVTLTCSHDDSNFDKLLWYKQLHGRGLRLLGYLSFKTPYEEDGSFNVSGDGEKEGFLKSSAVTAEECGVYFCAVSKAQCCVSPLTVTVNP